MYDEYILYYDSGRISVYGKFEEYCKVGDWTWYKEDGSIEGIEKNRINKVYSPDNKLECYGGEMFDEDSGQWIKNGRWTWFENDGKTIKDLKNYKYGEEVGFNKN